MPAYRRARRCRRRCHEDQGGHNLGSKNGRLPPNEKMGAGVMGGGTLALTQPVGIARRHNRFAPWDVPSWGSCADRRDHQSRRRHGGLILYQ